MTSPPRTHQIRIKPISHLDDRPVVGFVSCVRMKIATAVVETTPQEAIRDQDGTYDRRSCRNRNLK